jgi:molybdopterin adenylyltransferase
MNSGNERISPRVFVITVSDRCYRGIRSDLSGPAILGRLAAWGWTVLRAEIVPDDREAIAEAIRGADQMGADLILTTGGTGLAPRDVTPEATAELIDRAVPGIAESARAATGANNPLSYLSRGIAGLRGRTLIINLPGSPKGVVEYLDHLRDLLPHALQQAAGGGHRDDVPPSP